MKKSIRIFKNLRRYDETSRRTCNLRLWTSKNKVRQPLLLPIHKPGHKTQLFVKFMTDVKVPTMLLTMLSPRRVVSSLIIERQEYITQARGHPCTIRLPAQFRPAASLNRSNSLWVVSAQQISLWHQVDVCDQLFFPH